jgi:hypothetical protein
MTTIVRDRGRLHQPEPIGKSGEPARGVGDVLM